MWTEAYYDWNVEKTTEINSTEFLRKIYSIHAQHNSKKKIIHVKTTVSMWFKITSTESFYISTQSNPVYTSLWQYGIRVEVFL